MRASFAASLLALASLVACNALVGFHDLEKTPDAKNGSGDHTGDDDDVTPSSGRGACDPDADFDAPVTLEGPINQNDNGYSGSATLTSDELTIFFQRSLRPASSQAAPSGRIFKATRKKITDQFGPPAEVTELNPVGREFVPAIRADGLALFYGLEVDVDAGPSVPGATRSQVMLATRASPAAAFDKPAPFAPTKSELQYDTNPFATADGTEVYFGSLRGSTDVARMRIFRTTRTGDAFGEPEELVELRSTKEEFHAVLSFDGLTMYFGSDRTPAPKNGGQVDAYVAKRKDKSSKFENIEPLDAINSPAVEVPSWISKDNCRLYIERLVETAPQADGAPSPPFGVIMMATRRAR